MNRLSPLMLPNGKTYFFNGSQYYCADIETGKAEEGFPRPILGNWRGLWPAGIRAAVCWDDRKAYFFRGKQCIRYDIVANRADAGYPKPIAEQWPGLWPSGITAAVRWNREKAYFFRGHEYIQYDVASNRPDPGYPKPIGEHWRFWPTGIDGALLSKGKAYFTKGSEYVRYDIHANRPDAGYPKLLVTAAAIGLLQPQGGAGGGSFTPSRGVAVQGSIAIQDYETFGSNEHSTTQVWGYIVINKSSPVPAQLVQLSAVCGGEIRVELNVVVSVIDDVGNVIAAGQAKFFEGTSEGTGDLEQQKGINMLLPPGATQFSMHLWNEDEDEAEDNADITLTFSNEQV